MHYRALNFRNLLVIINAYHKWLKVLSVIESNKQLCRSIIIIIISVLSLFKKFFIKHCFYKRNRIKCYSQKHLKDIPVQWPVEFWNLRSQSHLLIWEAFYHLETLNRDKYKSYSLKEILEVLYKGEIMRKI